MSNKLQNLISFDEFDITKKEGKKNTKRTDTGLDIVQEKQDETHKMLSKVFYDNSDSVEGLYNGDKESDEQEMVITKNVFIKVVRDLLSKHCK